MSYGFKFFNNNNQTVIDDNNLKPWFHSQSQVTSVTNITSEYNRLNTSIFWGYGDYIAPRIGTWTVYRIRYSMPLDKTTFPAITIPSSNNNIWYYLEKPYAVTGEGYIDIVAYVPIDTVPVAADFPEVYAFAIDPILPGAGYGIQLFNSDGQCMFDSTKRHLQIYQYPPVIIPNSADFVGPGVPTNSNDVTGYLPTNPAFVFPNVKLGYANAAMFGNQAVVAPTIFARTGNTIHISNPPAFYTYSGLENPPPTFLNAGATSVNTPAGNFIVGATYVIASIGTTNFTLCGATSNTVGLSFIATDVGTGTGTAILVQNLLVIDKAVLYQGYNFPGLPVGYTLTANRSSITEGDSANPIIFTLTTTGLANGTQVPFTITGTGITAGDLSTGTLTGNFIINSNTATYSFYAVSDGSIEGLETASLTLNNQAASVSFQINDFVSYSLTKSANSIEEGQAVRVTLTTQGLSNGAQVSWIIDGLQSGDLESSPFGTFTINNGVASTDIKTLQDYVFDENDTITFRVYNSQQTLASIQIPIVEISTGFYETVSINPSTITTDGTTSVFFTGGQSYDAVRYIITPATYTNNDVIDYFTNDFKSTLSPGTVYLDEGGEYFNSSPTGADFGGVGNWKIWVRFGASKHWRTTNTVTVTQAATYSVAAAGGATSVNEGSSLTFNVTTTNVPNGTTLYWTVSNAGDFGTSSGSFTINNNSGSFSVTPTADNSINEGAETFQAQVRINGTGGTVKATSATITINDTSQLQASYNVTASPLTVNEGSGTTLTATVTGVPYGTVVYWIVGGTNITLNDIEYINIDYNDGNGFQYQGQIASGSFTNYGDETYTTTVYFQIFFKNDQITEGTEVIGFYLKSGSTSGPVKAYVDITINDTSQYPANGTPSGGPYCGTGANQYTKYQDYHNGTGGTYTSVLEYNSTYCGYVSYNETVIISNQDSYNNGFIDNRMSLSEAGIIVISNAKPNESFEYAILNDGDPQPTSWPGTGVYTDENGNFVNAGVTGSSFSSDQRTKRLWIRFPHNGNIRNTTVQVFWDSGTASGGQYCSGVNLMQNYWNGRGGTYSQTVQSNSPSCGYVQQYYPSMTQTTYEYNNAYGSYSAYFVITGARPNSTVRFTIIEGPAAVGAAANITTDANGTGTFDYGVNIAPYVPESYYIITATFPGQDAYYPAGYRTLTFYYYEYTDYGGGA